MITHFWPDALLIKSCVGLGILIWYGKLKRRYPHLAAKQQVVMVGTGTGWTTGAFFVFSRAIVTNNNSLSRYSSYIILELCSRCATTCRYVP